METTINYSDRVKSKIKSADDKLNKARSYNADDVRKNFDDLFLNGCVEVGYRGQCGATHHTQKVYREFTSIVKLLRKEGIVISEESVKHKNAYATNNDGFWNSTIFKIN